MKITGDTAGSTTPAIPLSIRIMTKSNNWLKHSIWIKSSMITKIFQSHKPSITHHWIDKFLKTESSTYLKKIDKKEK